MATNDKKISNDEKSRNCCGFLKARDWHDENTTTNSVKFNMENVKNIGAYILHIETFYYIKNSRSVQQR